MPRRPKSSQPRIDPAAGGENENGEAAVTVSTFQTVVQTSIHPLSWLFIFANCASLSVIARAVEGESGGDHTRRQTMVLA